MGKKQKVQNSAIQFISAIRFCFVLAYKASAFYTIIRIICSIAQPMVTLSLTLIGKAILDLLVGENVVSNKYVALWGYIGGELALIILRTVLQKINIYIQSVHNELIQNRLSMFLMEKSINSDLELFDNPAYYNKLSACTIDSMAMGSLLWNSINTVSALISTAVSFAMIAKYNVVYSILVLLASIPAAVVSAKYTKSIYSLSLEQINSTRQINYIQAISTNRNYALNIKFYQAGGILLEKYRRIWHQLFAERKKMNRRRCATSSLLECLPEVAAIYIAIDVAFQVMSGAATIGDYSLYYGLATQLCAAISSLCSSSMNVYDNQLKINNFKDLEQFSNRIKDTGATQLNDIYSIEFRNVSFTYPQTNKQILHDVSFTITSGEKVAIVGTNGSGKSTIIKLLLRFYDVNEGTILINGLDIRKYKVSDLRSSFTAYFQQEPNYGFTIRENMTISDNARADEERAIKTATYISGAEEIVQNAPLGINTFLTRLFHTEGIELSGGQYQRISLSRTFYKRHSALILDEPSSDLDPEAEYNLFLKFKEFSAGKIVLFTSHRLANVSLADRIIVLENGAIIESGDHNTLMNMNGRYAELYTYQQQNQMPDFEDK